MKPTRRQLLTTGFGAAVGFAALSPALSRLALATIAEDRYYVIAYFPAGWDVLMSMDPRADGNEQALLDGGIMRSLDRVGDIDDGALYQDSGLYFGPADFGGTQVTTCLNPLLQTFASGPASGLTDVGMCVVRGINMDTLSHEVGRRRFITGQPPVGQNARGSAMATVLTAMATRGEPIPNLAINAESYNVDQPSWATALGVANVNDLLRALRPAELSIPPEERERVQAMIDGFHDCIVARRSPQAEAARAAQLGSTGLVSSGLDGAFDLFANTPEMQQVRDRFRIPNGNRANTVEARAALAAQALTTGTSRVVTYAASDSLDTHFANWETDQFERQYVGFRGLAALIDQLADTPHHTSGLSMMEHTTILAFSDFSRTPMINSQGGRDHWLMNSCLMMGKGIRHGVVGASSDQRMEPTEVMIDGVSQYIRPEHLHQALLHDVGLPPDTVDLRVPPLLDVLSS